MSIRETFDPSAYLVIGPENTTRTVEEIVDLAVRAGFTFVQIRAKNSTAREIIFTLKNCADIIAALGKSETVALVVNDRLDIALTAREAGIKVDGVHVGQDDIPAAICRKYLGQDAIVGVSARTDDLLEYVRTADTSAVDYFGAGPLHETATKPDCGLTHSGRVIPRTFNELADLAKISKIPIVVGGGVKLVDIPALADTGVAGFFVVSAVASAENPYAAALELVKAWNICK